MPAMLRCALGHSYDLNVAFGQSSACAVELRAELVLSCLEQEIRIPKRTQLVLSRTTSYVPIVFLSGPSVAPSGVTEKASGKARR